MRIVQISDLHVCEPGRLYGGSVPSAAMARSAVERINSLDPGPDLVVVTGDLVADGTPEQYGVVRAILGGLRAPFLVMPGNHDDRDALRRAFPDHGYLPASGPLHHASSCGPVRVVALDTTVPGQHHGVVDAAGLGWLSARLAEGEGRPTLLFMHHHPVPSGIGFVDRYGLAGADGLERAVARHPEIERVLCGHVHRAFAARFGGTLAMACPSTCSQIALRLAPGAPPASHLEPPAGYLHVCGAGGPTVSHLFFAGDHGPSMGHF